MSSVFLSRALTHVLVLYPFLWALKCPASLQMCVFPEYLDTQSISIDWKKISCCSLLILHTLHYSVSRVWYIARFRQKVIKLYWTTPYPNCSWFLQGSPLSPDQTTQFLLVTSLQTVYPVQPTIMLWLYGSVSKPCTPGEHQNSW